MYVCMYIRMYFVLTSPNSRPPILFRARLGLFLSPICYLGLARARPRGDHCKVLAGKSCIRAKSPAEFFDQKIINSISESGNIA